MNPESPPAFQRESRREHLARLLAWCDERLRTHPGDVESLLKITEALWDMGRRAAALEYSKKILTQHPGHAKVREIVQRFAADLPGVGRGGRYEERS